MQLGKGVVPNEMFVNERNKLDKVEITYFEYDENCYTIRTDTWSSGCKWRDWIIKMWEGLSLIMQTADDQERESNYRRVLTSLTTHIETRIDHDATLPPSIRAVIHELQDRFNVQRTIFSDVV